MRRLIMQQTLGRVLSGIAQAELLLREKYSLGFTISGAEDVTVIWREHFVLSLKHITASGRVYLPPKNLPSPCPLLRDWFFIPENFAWMPLHRIILWFVAFTLRFMYWRCSTEFMQPLHQNLTLPFVIQIPPTWAFLIRWRNICSIWCCHLIWSLHWHTFLFL